MSGRKVFVFLKWKEINKNKAVGTLVENKFTVILTKIIEKVASATAGF